MPHACTNCGRTYPNGSTEMLSGCSDCGGHKFEFVPSRARRESDDCAAPDRSGSASADAEPDADAGRTDDSGSVTGPAGATPRRTDSSPRPTDGEDAAQATARAGVVSSDELPASGTAGRRKPAATSDDERASGDPGSDGERTASDPGTGEPSLGTIRDELDEQFESIKVLRPGQYELNLMELYDREEYIVSLQEDGRYVIGVPDSWHTGDSA